MKLTREERSWVLYDVANSAFILMITATLPIYFRSLAETGGLSDSLITAYWGTSTSIALIILAILSPVLGAMADYRGYKKRLFSLFLMIAIVAALGFTFAGSWQSFIALYIVARLGYSACNIFYDGMLVDVTSDERMDAISSYGYAFGYVGSTFPFILGVVLIFMAESLGLTTKNATLISFLIIILWWMVLSIPLLRHVKQNHYILPEKGIVSSSFKRVFNTMKDIRKDKKMFFFILAYFFYIDGVYTIISMATTYGGEVGIDSNLMLIALLLTQFVAFPFALLSIKLSKKYGALRVIKFYILMYAVIAVFGFFLAHAWQFWVLAVMIGIAQGGIQSLSRSYFGQMVPKHKANEYFGFFDIFGKFADFMGPLIIAGSSLLFNNSKYGVLMLVVLFMIGFVLITRVEKEVA